MRTKLGVAVSDSPGPESSPDRELWARLRVNDEGALSELFHRHRDSVYNFAFRRTSSWSSAEDVVQATFTALWRRAAEDRLDELTLDSARPVILRIATYECTNLIRSMRRLRALRDRLRTAVRGDVVPDHSAAAAANVDSERAMRELRAVLATIPAAQRDVIELVAWSGCSMAEAGVVLGIPEGTVKSRLARARRRLAGQLDLQTLEGLS
ncbi:RNA polymerase sigma factor [Kribbella sp. NPDC051587]|uniref:RNA polymerase sigma factor n=1 Tax=Kribbella sp. NPDC051587 TaxID=3364119 RepID=UPI003797914C